MGCSSENELVEFADGLLSGARAEAVARHVDGCSACRAVVAGLARAAMTRIDATAAASPQAADLAPADVVRAYMAKDARERELSASGLLGILLLLGTAQLAMMGDRRTAAVLAAVLAYEVAIHGALRRGWFHPAVPLVSTCVEVSIAFLVGLARAPAEPIDSISTPWLVFVGGQIVFLAIRTDPHLCLLGGALAALESLATYFLVRTRLVPLAPAFTPAGAGLRAVLMFACGVGGALLARHFVRRAVEALREIREQDMLGRYLLRERLGRGGMGEVYRATYSPDGGFVRNVAVKKLRTNLSADPVFVEAFRAEARLASTLAHPNLVQVIDCGRFRGDFVFVMEFVDGISLAQLLRALGRPLDPCAVAYIGLEIASALAHLQEQPGADAQSLELVHCDVNPPNVLLSRIGEVKLGDFGVMRAREPMGVSARGFGGKTTYAAPEQLSGAPLDGRCDLFALGLTLREALTGVRAFTNTQTALTHEVPPLSPDVSEPLRKLLDALVAVDPDARPRVARDVRLELERLTGELAPIPAGRTALIRSVADALAAQSDAA
jgi:serine/threonine-protein kinase